MAKFPYLTSRRGSKVLYYKRMVPLELRGAGRPTQIWRSLRAADRKRAERAYAATHAEVELLFAEWRKEESPRAGSGSAPPSAPAPHAVSLTPGLLRRLADAHYLDVYDQDFAWRGDLWTKVHEDEEAFWRGDVIRLPEDDEVERNGKLYSYFALLMEEPVLEEVFLYAVFRERKRRIQILQQRYRLGDSSTQLKIAESLLQGKGIALNHSDKRRVARSLMEAEIRALVDLSAGNEASFDGILERSGAAESPQDVAAAARPSDRMSSLIEKYLDEKGREREWPQKTVLRKRSDLYEFIEIASDKPVNGYTQDDGVKFKDVQLALPIHRQKSPFRGLSRLDAAKKATELLTAGKPVERLNPITVKDKLGTISLFFVWAKSRDGSVVNPVAEQRIHGRRNNRRGERRHPWKIDELNRMFAAPIYTGCRSERFWQEPGQIVLRESAKYWVPLIALFSGMRLGEIIQLQVADVKRLDDIEYFDVTPVSPDDSDSEEDDAEEEKSLKTTSSRRSIPIHQSLFEVGFSDFLEMRKASGEKRLFPEFEKAKDDGSWSKLFSKHFKRFRESIAVTRRGVKFHSLRHNVEDALRNASVRKEVRDAVQGHGENGVSREYGSGYYVTTLNDAVQKIEYRGLKLPLS